MDRVWEREKKEEEKIRSLLVQRDQCSTATGLGSPFDVNVVVVRRLGNDDMRIRPTK